MRTGNLDIYRTEIGGESVDLGGFKQYIHTGDIQRTLEWAINLNTNKFAGRIGEILKSAKNISINISIGMVTKGEFTQYLEEMLHKMEGLGDLQYAKLLEAMQSEGKDTSELERYKVQNMTIKELIELDKEPQIRKYSISADGAWLLNMSRRKEGFLRLDTINNDHPIIKSLIGAIIKSTTTTDEISIDDFNVLDDAISELLLHIETETPKFLLPGIKNVKEISSLHPISKSRRQDDLISALNMFFPKLVDDIIRGLHGTVEKQLARFRYLGPLRSYPPRHLAFTQYHDPNWQAGGGFAWDEVRKNATLRKKINLWLGDPEKLSTAYELVVQHLLTIDQLEKHFDKRVSEIEDELNDVFDPPLDENGMPISHDNLFDVFDQVADIPKELKKIEQYLSEIGELVLRDKRTQTTVSHRDVGIGISQVLPVLVAAYANREAIVAIEQPEIHLHPALQAELGDVFIESALGENKNTFLIETHSEHLLLRIMRRIRETTSAKLPEGITPVRPEDVMVLFVEPDGSRSIVREMPLNERGELIKEWPGGFFEEDFEELF